MSSRCHHIPWVAIVRHSGANEEDLKDHFFLAVKWLVFLAFSWSTCVSHTFIGVQRNQRQVQMFDGHDGVSLMEAQVYYCKPSSVRLPNYSYLKGTGG